MDVSGHMKSHRLPSICRWQTCSLLRLVLCLQIFGCFAAQPLPVLAHCFDLASQRYRVPAPLLRAIAEQESRHQPHASNRNVNGSVDIGLMQINSQWLPTLRQHGIESQDLWDPCVNVLVGAWILHKNFQRYGYNTQGLGAYNSGDPKRRERYAAEVLKRLNN